MCPLLAEGPDGVDLRNATGGPGDVVGDLEARGERCRRPVGVGGVTVVSGLSGMAVVRSGVAGAVLAFPGGDAGSAGCNGG